MKLIEFSLSEQHAEKFRSGKERARFVGDKLEQFFLECQEEHLFAISLRDGVKVITEKLNTSRSSISFSSMYLGNGSAVVRSLVSCRFVLFGYDYQVFLCTKQEDRLHLFGEEFVVVECSDLLLKSDVFDGF